MAGREEIAQAFEKHVGAGYDGEAARRGLEQRVAYRAALFFVGVEKLVACAVGDRGQLPREVGGVLNAGVHALPRHRRMDMRGVSRKKRAVDAIVRGLALVDVERRHPYG